MPREITDHAVARYQERVAEATPHGIREQLFQLLAQSRKAKARGRSPLIHRPRIINGRAYLYFYLRGRTNAGVVFFVAVDEDMGVAYTVLSKPMFVDLKDAPQHQKRLNDARS